MFYFYLCFLCLLFSVFLCVLFITLWRWHWFQFFLHYFYSLRTILLSLSILILFILKIVLILQFFFPFTICFPSLYFGTWSQMNRISMENTFIISLSKLQCILIFNVKNIDITFSVLQCILSNIAKHNIFWYNVVRYKKIFKHFTEKRCYRRFLIEFILYNSDNTFCS